MTRYATPVAAPPPPRATLRFVLRFAPACGPGWGGAAPEVNRHRTSLMARSMTDDLGRPGNPARPAPGESETLSHVVDALASGLT